MDKEHLNFYYNKYSITINCTDLFQYLSIEDYTINQITPFISKQFDIDTLTIKFSSVMKEFMCQKLLPELTTFLSKSQLIEVITEKVQSPYYTDYTNTFTSSKGTS